MSRNIGESGVVGANAGAGGGGGAPTGAAGGSLSGTYPNPTIAASVVTTTEILDGTIAGTDLNTAIQIPLRETMASDTTVMGLTVVKTAGEALAFGDLVYFTSGGTAMKASSTDNTKIAVGMAGAAISNAATGVILLYGTARNAAWSFTIGQILYLSTASILTGTAPVATDSTTQIMGICHPDTHHVFFRPSLDYVTHV